MAKRYVLLMASDDLDEKDAKVLAEILRVRVGAVKVILLKENPRAVVVKTDGVGAQALRSWEGISLGKKRLESVLTSGAIGKLKRRSLGGGVSHNGQVHE